MRLDLSYRPRAFNNGSTWLSVRALLGRAVALASARLIASALSAVWLFVAARTLSLRDFGEFGVILATTAVIISVSERGVQTGLAIHTAEHGAIDGRSLRQALARRLPVTVAGAIVNAGLYLAATHDTRWLVPVLAGITLVCTAVYGTLLGAYRALGRVRADALNEVLSRVFVLALGTVLLMRGGGLVAAVGTYAAADLASAVAVSIGVGWRHVARRARSGIADLSLRATLPLALVVTVLTVYNRIDNYLVALLRGDEAAGLYAASYRLLDVLTIPAIAVGTLVLSLTMRQNAADRLKSLRSLGALSFAVGVPVAAVGVLAAEQIMVLFYGPHFAAAASCATLLLLSAAPSLAVATVLPIVVPHDRTRAVVLSVAVLALNVAANLVMIPLAGLNGAAIANLLSQVALSAGVYRMAVIQRRRGVSVARVNPTAEVVPAGGTLTSEVP